MPSPYTMRQLQPSHLIHIPADQKTLSSEFPSADPPRVQFRGRNDRVTPKPFANRSLSSCCESRSRTAESNPKRYVHHISEVSLNNSYQHPKCHQSLYSSINSGDLALSEAPSHLPISHSISLFHLRAWQVFWSEPSPPKPVFPSTAKPYF